MEKFTLPAEQSGERARVSRLADKAEAWLPKVDLKKVPDGHVYRALDEERVEGSERTALIGPIKIELDRRRKTEAAARARLIKGAREAERLHPREDEEDAN